MADVSWGYKTDGVKFNKEGINQLTALERVTPSTNNFTLDKNEKIERFKNQDKFGASMTITSMLVVFLALVLLYVIFKLVGKTSVRISNKRKAEEATVTVGINPDKNEIPGEVLSAIFMALHEEQSDVHDIEHTILTFNKISRNYSPWSSKIYGLRQLPK